MTSQIVDRFVMFDDISDIVTGVRETASDRPLQKKELPCNMPGCTKMYKYNKARENHERKKHGLAVASVAVPGTARQSSEDHRKQHTEARLSFSFFLSNMQDAVKEGDGERLYRL